MKYTLIVVLACAVILTGCQTREQTGALVGGAGGAAAGALIGHAAGSTAAGVIIGGAAGAGGGYLIGRHMNEKEAAQFSENNKTINVPNSNGTTTPVLLTKQNNVWVGPQGETYANLPLPEDLKQRYGH
jgi:uncharacterized membrane protein YebE (DUF533 family)